MTRALFVAAFVAACAVPVCGSLELWEARRWALMIFAGLLVAWGIAVAMGGDK